MSIATSLASLALAKGDIADAITAKGGTVNSGDGFMDYAADIATISGSTGGTGTALITSNPSAYFDRTAITKEGLICI